MSLFIQVVTKRNRSTDTGPATSYLFSNKKTGDFYENPDGTVTFFQLIRDDRREKWDEYECSETSESFHAKVRETDNERWVYIQKMQEKIHRSRWDTKNQMIHLDTTRIIKAWNESFSNVTDGVKSTISGSRILYDRGPFGIIEIRTSHTIEEINAMGSESTSISAS